MLWVDEWVALSARVDAAVEVFRMISMAPAFKSIADNEVLTPECQKLYVLLADFHRRFETQLPPGATAALKEFFTTQEDNFNVNPTNRYPGVFLCTVLGSLRAQVDYFLADKQVRARRAVERAFTHLQRSLMADEEMQRKWHKAFGMPRAEEACEKLGAVHLLLHGIWAFKADAAGGKTDLILGGNVKEEDAVRAADAMALTEWKMVRKGEDPAKKATEAFHQAEQYTHGALAGFELSTYRYLVLVSEDVLPALPPTPAAEGRIYEVRNIAVAPSTPSVVARAAAGMRPP